MTPTVNDQCTINRNRTDMLANVADTAESLHTVTITITFKTRAMLCYGKPCETLQKPFLPTLMWLLYMQQN